MSGDAEQEYFAEGVSEDIITALSQFRWLFVVARNSPRALQAAALRRPRLLLVFVLAGRVGAVVPSGPALAAALAAEIDTEVAIQSQNQPTDPGDRHAMSQTRPESPSTAESAIIICQIEGAFREISVDHGAM